MQNGYLMATNFVMYYLPVSKWAKASSRTNAQNDNAHPCRKVPMPE
jgi:hypothetical protein